MCEEKPALVKVTGTKCSTGSITASGGRVEVAATTDPPCGWPGVQQSMGQGASLRPADKPELDAGAGMW